MSTMCSKLEVRAADLYDPVDQQAFLTLIDHYARHPMGQSKPLASEIKANLIPALQAHPATRVFLAWDGPRPIAMATCFIGFSTFKAKQLINIHDLVVHEDARGQGVGGELIDHVVAYAERESMCAVTLEVHEDNPARRLYDQKGFVGVSPIREEGTMLFGKRLLDVRSNESP